MLDRTRMQLMDKLGSKNTTFQDVGINSQQLEKLLAMDQEKLKLANYEKCFKDKRIMYLELRLKIAEEAEEDTQSTGSVKQDPLSTQISWNRVSGSAKTISPQDLARLRQKATKQLKKMSHFSP